MCMWKTSPHIHIVMRNIEYISQSRITNLLRQFKIAAAFKSIWNSDVCLELPYRKRDFNILINGWRVKVCCKHNDSPDVCLSPSIFKLGKNDYVVVIDKQANVAYILNSVNVAHNISRGILKKMTPYKNSGVFVQIPYPWLEMNCVRKIII